MNLLTFEQAVLSKRIIYQETDLFGNKEERKFLIVPSKDNDFQFYLESISKMDLQSVTDETAIKYCTDNKYSFAFIEDSEEGLNFERLFPKEEVPENCVNSWQHLEQKAYR